MISTFTIGEQDFLLDGRRLQIRCGELHFARVPREYWRHRIQLCKAMGLNAVCAYLFWNLHEWEQGTYDWSGQADAAHFCRLAQEEGLWVLLRPGPYACAEWEMGGLPWWLLRNENIALRSRDPDFLAASRAWLAEVGRVLGPLQVSRGGPILMAQVENEYGFYGKDAAYMGEMRQALLDAGFEIPLFACNPVSALRNGWRDDLFPVVNFGSDPENGFRALRAVLPTGPLMCGEFYPGWFDTWGAPHHRGDAGPYLADLDYMLSHNASFSIYMAHGGTTFGLWSGTDRPFKPDTSSYDYDAPISEAGWIGEKFHRTRELMARYLLPGETLPEPPPANPTIAVPPFPLDESAALFDNLPAPIADTTPRTMEAYDQGRGCTLYRTILPPGPEALLAVKEVHDFAWVFVEGERIGVLDRRRRRFSLPLPARSAPARLDILVEAVGRVNFGAGMHDRKGLHGPISVTAGNGSAATLEDWQVYRLDLEAPLLAGLQWSPGPAKAPAFRRGHFDIEIPADTFLDVSAWGKGVLWVNKHCLGRFWNIGPTQTMYLPGPWMRPGRNEVVVLDLTGPDEPILAGLETPILDRLRPERDFSPAAGTRTRLALAGVPPIHTGRFADGPEAQDVRFAEPVTGRQVCLETLGAHDGGLFASVGELDLLDADGESISHDDWTVAYVSSEENGSAVNAIDGQISHYWHTERGDDPPGHPHHLVLDLGAPVCIGGLHYTPRAGGGAVTGRIKDFRVYVGDALVRDEEA